MSSQPIAVFDAGIGSYAVVDLIRKKAPAQDILYLADRASFPYGGKSREELLHSVEQAVRFLATHHPSAIVLASNAPSVMVLSEIQKKSLIPIFGIVPPVREAVQRSSQGHVAVLGVLSLIKSEEIRSYIAEEAGGAVIHLVNGSPLVELVESGIFLSNPTETQNRVDAFLHAQWELDPKIDVFTLSSTHLPWLRPFFEKSAPETLFLDPAETLVKRLPLASSKEAGKTIGFVTENELYPSSEFRIMLERLGISIPVHDVTF